MLGKVMKYEFRAMGRMLLPFFGLALVGSGVLRLLFWLAPKIWAPVAAVLGGFLGFISVLLVLAVILVGLIIAVVRFYQTMVTTEGFLSFTLPVTTGAHITGRLIVGSLFSALGFVVALGCISILVPGLWPAILYTPVFSSGGVLGSASYAIADLPAQYILSAVGMVAAFILVTVVTNLLQVYAAIGVGTKITKNRVAGSIIGYFIVNTVQGFLMMPLMLVPFIGIMGESGDALQEYVLSLVVPDAMATLGNMLGVAWLFVGIVSLIALVFAAAQYWLTWFFLDKKLNLE